MILTSFLYEMLMITGGWRVANLWQIGQVRRARGPVLWPVTWVTNVWPGPHLASHRQNIRPENFSELRAWDRVGNNKTTIMTDYPRMDKHICPDHLGCSCCHTFCPPYSQWHHHSFARSFFSQVSWSLIITRHRVLSVGRLLAIFVRDTRIIEGWWGSPPCPKVVMMAINPSPALFTTPDTVNLKMIAT